MAESEAEPAEEPVAESTEEPVEEPMPEPEAELPPSVPDEIYPEVLLPVSPPEPELPEPDTVEPAAAPFRHPFHPHWSVFRELARALEAPPTPEPELPERLPPPEQEAEQSRLFAQRERPAEPRDLPASIRACWITC